MLECVINVSEGRRSDVVELIAARGAGELLDVHTDPDHNRSVVTVVGEEAARDVATAAVLALDLRSHDGVHPRFGVVDIVPFVPLLKQTLDDALAARARFAAWMVASLGVPCFLYGPDRTLPELRRRAFVDLAPDVGPDRPHPTAGACAVGARPFLLAYNVWLDAKDLDTAKALARELRSAEVRALAFTVEDTVQVSMNLVDPLKVGPADVYDRIAARAPVRRAELVGLVPEAVLARVPKQRWRELDLADDRTIEARLRARGLLPER